MIQQFSKSAFFGGTMRQTAMNCSLMLGILACRSQVGVAQMRNAEIVETKAAPEFLPSAPSPSSWVDHGVYSSGASTLSAPKYADTIEPDYQAQPLSVGGKVVLAGAEVFSVQFPVSVVVAAGLSHGFNSDPNYGTNREAFAKRVGAAGARESSEIVFSHAILAPLFHQDPRYYVKGPGHHILSRVTYAATRVLIGRKDNGRNTVNFAELGGYGGSAALSQLYYPRNGRDRDVMLSTYGSSLGGLAIQNEIYEFFRFLSVGQRQ